MTFAEKLKAMRTEQGVSERALAKASGVPHGTLHTYAIGTRKPSFAYVVKIARALGVDCTAFADCEDILGAETESDEPALRKRKPTSGNEAQPKLADAVEPEEKKGRKPRK